METTKPKATIKKEFKGVKLSESYVPYEKFDPKKYAKKQPTLVAYKPKRLSDSEVLIDNEDEEQEITEEDIMTER